MTRKQKLLLVALFMASAILGYLFSPSRNAPQSDSLVPPLEKTIIESIDKRIFVGPDKKTLDKVPSNLKWVNKPDKNWKEKTEKSLRLQSKAVKNITINPERSLVIIRDGNALLVESVVITLTNQADEESSFRAVIDSQTGKILETWDRSITDSMNPRDEFKFKLNPRYE